MLSIFQKYRYIDVDIDVSPNTIEPIQGRSTKDDRVTFLLIINSGDTGDTKKSPEASIHQKIRLSI